MTEVPQLDEIAAQFSPGQEVATGKWFGKPCLKACGKVFAALWGGDMAFKLSGEAHSEALQVKGARPFDPRGKGHPLKEWVQIPAAQSVTWSHFAKLAYEYVAQADQVRKDGVISELVEARRTILDVASSLSPAQQDEVFLGIWSAEDLLAHLVGWDFANVEAVHAIRAGKVPAFYAHHDPNWRAFNARLVAEHKRDDFADLLASVEDSHRQLIDLLRAVPAAEFDQDYGVRFKGYRVTIARLMLSEAKDERKHHGQLRAFASRSLKGDPGL